MFSVAFRPPLSLTDCDLLRVFGWYWLFESVLGTHLERVPIEYKLQQLKREISTQLEIDILSVWYPFLTVDYLFLPLPMAASSTP